MTGTVTYFLVLSFVSVSWGSGGVENRVREVAIFAGTSSQCQEWGTKQAKEDQREWDESTNRKRDTSPHYSDRRYGGGVRAARVHSFLCAELGDANAVRDKLPRHTWANVNQVGPGRPDGKTFDEVMDK